MFGIGSTELLLFALIALIFVGPDKLPEIMRNVGRGTRKARKASRQLRDAIGIDEWLQDADSPPVRAAPPPQPIVSRSAAPDSPADTQTPNNAKPS